jgi:hypothetical protein
LVKRGRAEAERSTGDEGTTGNGEEATGSLSILCLKKFFSFSAVKP